MFHQRSSRVGCWYEKKTEPEMLSFVLSNLNIALDMEYFVNRSKKWKNIKIISKLQIPGNFFYNQYFFKKILN